MAVPGWTASWPGSLRLCWSDVVRSRSPSCAACPSIRTCTRCMRCKRSPGQRGCVLRTVSQRSRRRCLHHRSRQPKPRPTGRSVLPSPRRLLSRAQGPRRDLALSRRSHRRPRSLERLRRRQTRPQCRSRHCRRSRRCRRCRVRHCSRHWGIPSASHRRRKGTCVVACSRRCVTAQNAARMCYYQHSKTRHIHNTTRGLAHEARSVPTVRKRCTTKTCATTSTATRTWSR